jgi:hypothetical protein
MRTTVLASLNSMLLMSQTQISDIPSFWSSSQFHATVANYGNLPHSDWFATFDRSKPIRIPYMPIFATVRFDLIVAKIDHIWATRYGVFLKDAIF